MLENIKTAIKRRPLLFRVLYPFAYLFFRLRDSFSRRRTVRRIIAFQAPYPTMDAAAAGGGRSWSVGPKASGCEIVMLVVSDLRVDPRVEREARALVAAGYGVTVICPEPSEGAGASFNIDWGAGVIIKYIHWTAGTFMGEKPGYLADKLYTEAVRHSPFAFHAHDLSVAYAALAAAKAHGCHLVVDFHEWFSENVHWSVEASAWAPYPDDWRNELRKLESRCLVEASATITVCDSIADGMLTELGGTRPIVVRNIPDLAAMPTREYTPLKQQLGLPESTFVLLWQGGTGPTRLIEPIIESLTYAPACVFVIRGPSLDIFGPDYLALARRLGVEDRVLLVPPVPSRDVVAAARGADAGIWTLPALCRNFTYALPNKIFEYIASGLPVLAAHYPEAKRLLADHDIGLTFDPYDPHSIAAAINQLIDDPALLARFRTNTSSALHRLDAGAEWQKLVALYDGLPRSG
jgi:glycosyltransferase involved in cell wall biosynthesis